MKLSDLGAHGAEDSVLSLVRVHTEAVVTGVWWWRKTSQGMMLDRDTRLMVSHCYINTDGQGMKRKC